MDRIRIKHRLLDHGISLADLARYTGIAYDRLIRIVHGYRFPRSEEIDVIARALDLSVDDVQPRDETGE